MGPDTLPSPLGPLLVVLQTGLPQGLGLGLRLGLGLGLGLRLGLPPWLARKLGIFD